MEVQVEVVQVIHHQLVMLVQVTHQVQLQVKVMMVVLILQLDNMVVEEEVVLVLKVPTLLIIMVQMEVLEQHLQ